MSTLKRLFFVLAPSIALGSLLGAYPGYEVYRYIWNDARFCNTCHVHDYAYESWRESIHGKLTTCHDCHHQPLRQYILEPITLIMHQPKFPKDLKHMPNVARDLCESCHVSDPKFTDNITGPLPKEKIEQVPKVDRLWLHELHLNKKVRLAAPNAYHISDTEEFGKGKRPLGPERAIVCMDCHGAPPNRAHNFTATDRSCTYCHEKTHVTDAIRISGCRNCHFQDFMVPSGFGKSFVNEAREKSAGTSQNEH
ncbi:MAG: NapC/NirT family cytochrome c [Oligoflexia bacterium]|nr:NapC/NirT family cytochrome c [Oligoflexia bacterium]